MIIARKYKKLGLHPMPYTGIDETQRILHGDSVIKVGMKQD